MSSFSARLLCPRRWPPALGGALALLMGASLAAFPLRAVPGDHAPAEVIAAERRANSIATAAKLLASGVFVSGRLPEDLLFNDLRTPLYTAHDWREVSIHLDRAARRVTLSAPGVAPRTALYTGDHAQGCVLLPPGETELLFKPLATSPRPGPRSDAFAGQTPTAKGPLAEAVASAFVGTPEAAAQNTRALLVVHRGKLVAEQYAPGFAADMPLLSWSMGKTVLAALLGVLAEQGALPDLDSPAPISEWQRPGDPRADITLRHLLQMSGGLDCPSPAPADASYATTRDIHESIYYGVRDAHALMTARPLLDPPGSRWQYRNTNPMALGRIVREIVEKRGDAYLAFPQRALFDKIGATSFVLETDQSGNFLITGYDYATARDWARLGLLLLRDGIAPDGTRVLAPGWVATLREPVPAAPNGRYGGQVWLNRGGAFPSLPRDVFYARGWQEQIVMVFPSHDLVLVRLGHSPGMNPPVAFNPYFDRVAAAILTALKDA